MNRKKLQSLALAAMSFALLAPAGALAAKFANQFVEFELPPQWQCNLEGAEWVCQSAEESKKRDAIIVLAAKLKGDQDSIDQYLAYLKEAKSYNSVQGKPVKSEPKYAKTVPINEHAWVDALHLESEVPGFYTRYLATVKEDIGVLVTYSINKDKYQAYLKDFDNLVNTLKVFRKPGGINAKAQDANIFANTQIPSGLNQGSVFPTDGEIEPEEGQPKKKPQEEDLTLYLVLGGAAVAYILWRRRQGG